MGLRPALAIIALVGLTGGAVVAGITLSSGHVDNPGLLVALQLAIGWSFVGTGILAWWRRPDNRTGALMVGVGLAWFLTGLAGSDLAGWFTAGVLLSNVHVAVFVHLVLAFPEGRLGNPAHRRLAGAAYALALVACLPMLLFGEPADFRCEDCPASAISVGQDDGVQTALEWALTVATLGLVAAVVRVLVVRWRRASGPRRRAVAPVLWSGVALLLLLAGSLTAYSLGLPAGVADALGLAGMLAFLVAPFGFLAELARSRWARGVAVSDMLQRLSVSAGTNGLRGVLADALGDPTLEIVYWLDDSDRWVCEAGRPTALPEDGDRRRAVAPVELDGERIGAIVHDRALDDADLVRTVAAGAALAVRHERLQAQLRARVEELRESRARLAAAGVAERRRLERNLHDGAQQRLVALSLNLRLAHSRIDDDPGAARALLAAGQEELATALEELRELARGIHPAVLTDRGLPAALQALAERSPVPVDVAAPPGDALPAPVEAAAYFVVAEALTNVAKYARASRATVAVERVNGHAVVEVADDGVGGADPGGGSGLRGLLDRVNALDGRLRIESREGAGTRLRAEIPVP